MTLLTNTFPRVNKAVSNMAGICNARILLKSWYIIFPFCLEFLYPFGVWSIATVFHLILEVWSRGGVLAAHKYMKDICSIHSSKRHDNIRSFLFLSSIENFLNMHIASWFCMFSLPTLVLSFQITMYLATEGSG